MKIDKLDLISFGKFQNKQIEFKDNINIIYGLNESGKSTIHSFINGMFYGFLRPYVNRALYTADHEKYDPWYSSEYKGRLDLTKDSINYSIERNFEKGKEYTKIYLKNTGEDITDEVDNGNSGRILQPGYEFLGFNDIVFNNTVFIKQLSNKTDEALAKEVKDKLVNISTTLDDGISIKDSIEFIDSNIKEIGSERAYTSPLGASIKDLSELESKRKNLKGSIKDYENIINEKNSIEDKISDIKSKINSLENIKNNVLLKNKKETYEKVLKLEEDIENLEGEISKLSMYADLSMDDYTKLIEANRNQEEYVTRLKDIEIELTKEQEHIEEIKRDLNENFEYDEQLPTDYEEIEKINFKINQINDILKENDIRFLKIDQAESNKKKQTYFAISIASLILALLCIASIFFLDSKIQVVLTIVFIPIFIYYYKKFKKAEGLLLRIEKYITDVSLKQENLLAEKERLSNEKIALLEKYGTENELDIKKIYDNISLTHLRKKDHKKVLENITKRNILLVNSKSEYNEKLRNAKESIILLMEKNNCSSIDEFKVGLNNKSLYENKLLDLNSKNEILENLLNESSKDDIKKEIEVIESLIVSSIQNLSLDLAYVEDDIKLNTEELRKLELYEKEIEEKIKTIESYNKDLLEVEERIDYIENNISTMNEKLKSLNLARDTIEKLSKEIHRDFAPIINKNVGDIISRITNGKYTDVSIKDNLDIKVSNPKTNELIDFEQLSGGTIDQVYFSLRYGISIASNETNLPLILDDCFIQYDEKRLENILSLLVEEGKNRQILLFTCQNREKEILDKMKIDYNYIEM